MNFSVYVRMLAYSYLLICVEIIDSRPEMHERRQRGDSQLFPLTISRPMQYYAMYSDAAASAFLPQPFRCGGVLNYGQ